MKLRIEGLRDLDPLSVPIPVGTEVSTRIDRMIGERLVPQGALGRVSAQTDAFVEVEILGVGRAQYARDELTPRKVGQASFAERREASWSALANTVIVESIVGSQAWGLASEGSDVDRKGIFALPFRWTLGLQVPPQDLVSADGSTSYWELRKFFRQALRADPNTLEMLFVQSVRAMDPIGEQILRERQLFVSREIYSSFGRYALSQLKKLQQSMRLAEHRALILDWLSHDPTLELDAVATRLAKETAIEAPTPNDALMRAKEYIKQLYRSMHDQGLIRGTEFSALVEFAQGPRGEFELPRELRPKNAYNLLRLMQSGIDWLTTGEPSLEVTGTFRQQLLSIKQGEVPLAAVLAQAEAMAPQLEHARQVSPLPAKADLVRADQLLAELEFELARRAVSNEPGPWSRAPAEAI